MRSYNVGNLAALLEAFVSNNRFSNIFDGLHLLKIAFYVMVVCPSKREVSVASLEHATKWDEKIDYDRRASHAVRRMPRSQGASDASAR